MTTFNLRASNNATFHWTRDLSQFAEVYNLAAATIRMQARMYPEAPDPPIYSWVTGASTGGVVTFYPTTNIVVFTAPECDMASLPFDLAYDARIEFENGATVPIFGGRLLFSPGVTRLLSDPALQTGTSGIGDTVSVDGERGSCPVPLPLGLSAVLTPSAFLMVAAQFTQAQINAWNAIFGGTGPTPPPVVTSDLVFNPISALTVAVMQ